MKSNYLFPSSFKKIGWLLFVPGVVFGLLIMLGNWEPEIFKIKVFALLGSNFMSESDNGAFIENNVIDEVAAILVIVGAMFIAFAREKIEDEFISKIRMESLVWAVYVNYAVLILTLIFVYNMSFFTVLVLNMFTILFFFIIRFNVALMKSKKQLQDEK